MDPSQIEPPAVTPDRTPEAIERDMAQTREAISEKVAALETQVMGTVQNAADTITGTVQAVKDLVTTGPAAVTDTVKSSVAAVSEAVKEQFDISKRVREHPWGAVLTAAGSGFFLGFLTAQRRQTVNTHLMAQHAVPAQPQQPREPGVLDQLWTKIRTEVSQLAEEAYTTATTSLRENLHTQVPNLIKSTIDSGTNGLHNRIQERI